MKVLVWIDLILALWFVWLFCTSFLERTKESEKMFIGFKNRGWRITYGLVSMFMIFVTITGLYEYYL